MHREANSNAAAQQEKTTLASTGVDSQAKPAEQKPLSAGFLVLINLGMVVTGSMTTIFGKIIDQHVLMPKQGANGETIMVDTEFKHPLIMNLLMFAGESMLLIILALQLARDPVAAARHQKNKANPLIFTAPALLDTLGSFCNFTGLVLISASTFQIMKMLCMVFVVLLSVTVMQKRYTILQYLSLGLVVCGLLFVSLMDIWGAKQGADQSGRHHNDQHSIIVGMLALIAGQFFHASHAIL